MGNHRRFFIGPSIIDGDMAIIDGELAHQIGRVLRLKEGDPVCLLDGLGNEHEARITALSKDEVRARIASTERCPGEPSLKLTLAICLPKGDKLELIVQKCCELGISGLIAVSSERSVARLDPGKAASRLERWRKIATEAAEQSGRGTVPEIQGILGVSDLVSHIQQHSLALVAWEDEDCTSLREVLREHRDASSMMLIVGPEGGFSEREIECLRAAGARCVSLGKRLLRCETAAIAACAAIMYELEGEL